MTKLSRLLVTAAIIVAAPHPAAAVQSGNSAAVHQIGVISALGSKVAIENYGVIGIGDKETFLDAGDWNIDAFVRQRVAKDLSSRYEITPIEADPAEFALPPPRLFAGAVNSSAAIRGLPAARMDAYLVVRSSLYEVGGMLNRHWVSGLGVYRLATRVDETPHAFTAYQVELVQAGTGRVLAVRVGYMKPASPLSDLSGVKVKVSEWPSSTAPLTGDKLALLRSDLLDALGESLDRTLASMHLTTAAGAQGEAH